MLRRKTDYLKLLIAIFLCLMITGHTVYADQKIQKQSGSVEDDYFAIINNQKISAAEYLYRFRKAVKEKFYHGKVSQQELDTFKKEVAEQLVLEILLGQEARKRGLHPDASKIAQELKSLDTEFSNTETEKERESWAESRDRVLPIIRSRIEREALVKQLQERVKNVKQPSLEDIKSYFEKNKDKFTEPQQWDVSIILLSVDPSSSSEVWEETVEKAEKLLKKIRKGESFEELARIHSSDESAVKGGHMGYMHLGMFGAPAQKVLNVMEPGDLSEPVVLLEGVAIFRLNDVRKADLNAFEDVQERAKNLLIRERSEKAWADLLASVRASADVKYSDVITADLSKTLNSNN